MIPFGALFEARASLENPRTPFSEAFVESALAIGQSLTDDQLAALPDVYACHHVLAQDVAKTPCKLRRHLDGGKHEDSVSNPLWELLHDLPNPETTSYDFRYQMMRDLLKYEHAYAEIVRRPSGEILALWRLDPRAMKITRKDGVKVYTYEPQPGRVFTWTFNPDRPPILELHHASPLRQCRELLGLAYALETFGAKFFANGARVSGVLELPPGNWSDPAKKNLRESFSDMYASFAKAFKVPLLEHGVTFKPVTAPNDEAQFIETKKYVRTQIAGVHRIPPHKIGDLDKGTFSNIEHLAIEYVGDAVEGYFVCWEQAFRRDLLTTRQFPRYRAMFDREALIRADILSSMQAWEKARQNGVLSTDDIRLKIGENPIGAELGGDAYLVNGNMIPITKAGQQKQQDPASTAAPAAGSAA